MRTLNIVIVVLFLVVNIFAAERKYPYFFNANLTINDRFATYELQENVLQNENRALLPTFGIRLGRMIYLPLHLRIAFPLHYDVGSAADKTLKDVSLADGSVVDTQKRSMFNSFGISPEIQYEFLRIAIIDLFAGVGFGLHYSILSESEWYNNTRILDTQYLETYNTFCASFCGSGGIEFKISKFMGFQVVYRFRMWYPVNSTVQSDLFPYQSVKYKERFISNQIGAGILIGK